MRVPDQAQILRAKGVNPKWPSTGFLTSGETNKCLETPSTETSFGKITDPFLINAMAKTVGYDIEEIKELHFHLPMGIPGDLENRGAGGFGLSHAILPEDHIGFIHRHYKGKTELDSLKACLREFFAISDDKNSALAWIESTGNSKFILVKKMPLKMGRDEHLACLFFPEKDGHFSIITFYPTTAGKFYQIKKGQNPYKTIKVAAPTSLFKPISAQQTNEVIAESAVVTTNEVISEPPVVTRNEIPSSTPIQSQLETEVANTLTQPELEANIQNRAEVAQDNVKPKPQTKKKKKNKKEHAKETKEIQSEKTPGLITFPSHTSNEDNSMSKDNSMSIRELYKAGFLQKTQTLTLALMSPETKSFLAAGCLDDIRRLIKIVSASITELSMLSQKSDILTNNIKLLHTKLNAIIKENSYSDNERIAASTGDFAQLIAKNSELIEHYNSLNVPNLSIHNHEKIFVFLAQLAQENMLLPQNFQNVYEESVEFNGQSQIHRGLKEKCLTKINAAQTNIDVISYSFYLLVLKLFQSLEAELSNKGNLSSLQIDSRQDLFRKYNKLLHMNNEMVGQQEKVDDLCKRLGKEPIMPKISKAATMVINRLPEAQNTRTAGPRA